MMRKLLFSGHRPFQLAIAWAGALAGFFLILASTQLYIDFKSLLTEKNDWIHPEYLVINKRISILNAFSAQKGFSEKEIQELENLEGVSDVGRFVSNGFKVAASMAQPGKEAVVPGMYAELFFEALPDRFLDVRSGYWKWQAGSEIVPVIIPADYLKLYNFGFAPGQNLPQISEKTASAVLFDLHIDSAGTAISLKGRIAGYSNRINSVLVPESFMEHANRSYGGRKEAAQVSRLVLVVKNPSDAAIINFLDKKGYETNAEQLRNARLNTVLQVIVMIVALIGSMLVFMAILGFVQYTQLAMNRSAYEIRTLTDLGYSPFRLFRSYAIYSLFLLGGIALVSTGGVHALKICGDAWLSGYGIEVESGIRLQIYWEALLIFALFLFFQLLTVYNGISRLSAPVN
jgi:hypothetical protein